MTEPDPHDIAIELAERLLEEVAKSDPTWPSVSTWARRLLSIADHQGGPAAP